MPLFDPNEFMVRLRNGGTPREITSGKLRGGARVDGVGSYKAFDAYCAANPEWGREAAMLVERNTAAAQKRKGGGRGSLIHCKNGHPFLVDNLIWKPRSDGGQGLWHCCKTCKRETTKRGALMNLQGCAASERSGESRVQNNRHHSRYARTEGNCNQLEAEAISR